MKTKRVEIVDKLRLELPKLEGGRKDLLSQKRRKVSYVLVPGGIALCLFIGYMWPIMGGVTLGMAFIPLFFLVLFLSEFLKFHTPRLQKRLQQSIGESILRQLYPAWTFQADHHLELGSFKELGVVNNAQRYDGSNLVTGKHGDTEFAFCHLHVYQVDRDESSPSFNGLLLVFDFNKDFRGKTLVIRDQAQKMLGSYLGKKVQEFGWRGLKLVYLEDTIFEKFFAVYGRDQIESRYILTPQMMQNLIQLRRKYGEYISFSFVDGKVAVAIDHVYLYQTNIESPIHLEAAVDQFLRPVEIVRDVIDTLQLNTRIWTK